MNAAARDALWQRLAGAGVVQGEQPSPSSAAGPWYLRAMSGAAAWIAALFLIVFIGMALRDLVRTDVSKIVIGVMLCAGAMLALLPRAGVFVAQLGLATSLAGQALVALGVFGMFRWTGVQGATAALVVAIFEAVLALVVFNVVHRVITTAAAALSLAWGLWTAGLGTLGLVVAAALFVAIELNERWLGRWPRAVPAIGLGLALAIIAILPIQVAADEFAQFGPRATAPAISPFIADVAMGGVFFGASLWMIARSGVGRGTAAHIFALTGALALAVVSIGVPGLSAALLILLCGFATAQRLMIGIGTLALLAALSRYYYALSATLLVKSGVLLATALVLLALWFALRRMGERAGTGGHA